MWYFIPGLLGACHEVDDGCFARHHTFRYIALNTLMRQQHSRFYINKQHRTALTKDELRQALEDPDRPAQAILNRIYRYAGVSYQRNASLLVQEAA